MSGCALALIPACGTAKNFLSSLLSVFGGLGSGLGVHETRGRQKCEVPCGHLVNLYVHVCSVTVVFLTVQTYVVFLTEMGGVWVERHLPTIAKHVLELVAHPKTTQSHIDAVYARKCVGFIFRSVFGKLLGESAQFIAAKHLCQLIVTMSVVSSSSASSGGSGGAQGGQGEQPLEGV